MALTLTSLRDLTSLGGSRLIDARAPSEFAEDAIPGAVNLPVLSDEERARVGTIYKQQSPFDARKIGAALVARNVAAHLEGPLAGHEGGWQPVVYCWRGGQRSGAFATILGQVGWRVETIAGGYRAYRRLVTEALYNGDWPSPVVVLDGNTGTAKTELLGHLAGRGFQVIDLEGLARHRGSVLGPVAGGQPTQKRFESAIAAQLARIDPARPVILEAESSKVGDLLLPPAIWRAIRAAPRVVIEASLEPRAAYLTRAYADLVEDRAALADRLGALVPYHGHDTVAAWTALAGRGAFQELAAALMAAHYDPRYAKSRGRVAAGRVVRVQAAGLAEADLPGLAAKVAEAIEGM